MKLIEIKQLKEDTIYKKILNVLKLKGLDTLYIQKPETVNYIDVILNVLNFIYINKKIIKKVNKEKLLVIIVIEILEDAKIEISEETIEKIILLLKNSLLVQNLTTYLYEKFVNIFKFKCLIKRKSDFV